MRKEIISNRYVKQAKQGYRGCYKESENNAWIRGMFLSKDRITFMGRDSEKVLHNRIYNELHDVCLLRMGVSEKKRDEMLLATHITQQCSYGSSIRASHLQHGHRASKPQQPRKSVPSQPS